MNACWMQGHACHGENMSDKFSTKQWIFFRACAGYSFISQKRVSTVIQMVDHVIHLIQGDLINIRHLVQAFPEEASRSARELQQAVVGPALMQTAWNNLHMWWSGAGVWKVSDSILTFDRPLLSRKQQGRTWRLVHFPALSSFRV
mgnify:CR=1 FL=1